MRTQPRLQRIIVLGSTITALAVVRNCHSVGIECFLIDIKEGPASLSRFPKVEILEEPGDKLILSRIRSLAAGTPSVLIADSDFWLRWIMRFRSLLDKVLVEILHPTNDVLRVCLNKSQFLQWCEKEGVSAPKIYPNGELQGMERQNFPLLVRPEETRHGAGGCIPKACEVSNVQQLSRLLEKYKKQDIVPSVSESLLPRRLKQFSVGVAKRNTDDISVIVAEKLRPDASECAGGTYVKSVPDIDVENFARSISKKLNIYGIAEIEILKDIDSGEMFVVEVNPRPWVQYALACQAGFDFLTFMLDSASENRPHKTPSPKAWLSFGDDLYVVMSRSQGMFRDNRISLAEYLQSIIRPNIHAVWSWRDPKPLLVGLFKRLTS